MGLEEKRRKFGRFCGLRGCESPVEVGMAAGGVREDGVEVGMEMEVDGEEVGEQEVVMMVIDEGAEREREREREVRGRMEREWRAAVRRGREEEEWREKVGGRRFW